MDEKPSQKVSTGKNTKNQALIKRTKKAREKVGTEKILKTKRKSKH